MKFEARQFTRSGVIRCKATVEEVFPLLCPKREEEWIPGWECETVRSLSGYNESGAIFRTTKPYGTELYWNTLEYDIDRRRVDFLIMAPRLYMFRFRIEIAAGDDGVLALTFTQTFTSVSEEGSALLKRYEADDFPARLKDLEAFMTRHLEEKRKTAASTP
ncbi:MAG: hypothetical protein JW884_10800 [Deltaproteobacteria bacterium]|nr:hypothetical protein [Deltaproteobacteria bacterium]